jgi:hypothetical protein
MRASWTSTGILALQMTLMLFHVPTCWRATKRGVLICAFKRNRSLVGNYILVTYLESWLKVVNNAANKQDLAKHICQNQIYFMVTLSIELRSTNCTCKLKCLALKMKAIIPLSAINLFRWRYTTVILSNYISSFILLLNTVVPVTVAVRSEAWVLAGWLLGSWVRNPPKAWMFVPCLSVLCCPV